MWNPDLDWYFNEFESLIGFKSIGTSGVGDNELREPTDEEKTEKKERQRNGFLLSLPEQPKAQLRSITPADADRFAFQVMANGILARGRRVWRKLARLPYSVQECLRVAYSNRIINSDAEFGPPVYPALEVRLANAMYAGKARVVSFEYTGPRLDPLPPELVPWKNPTPCGLRHTFQVVHHE